MSHSLLVPIHLDALVLAEPRLSVGPRAHFARLPHAWKGADVNPDVPNLGKSVIAAPFQDEDFLLAKGVHLHWALPDGLTRARHSGDGASGSDASASGSFPAVPNRWLVVRRREAGGKWLVENEWVVESDYLCTQDCDAPDHVSVPSAWTHPRDESGETRPYRHLGRRMRRSEYTARVEGNDYLAVPLTAMGHGEPTFSSVYQNCHRVFGLHDPDVPTVETRYDVFGWYGGAARDPLHDAIARDDAARAAVVEARFGWRVDGTKGIAKGTETICFVSMTIPAHRATRDRYDEVELAAGNTGSEALSAYLAGTLEGGERRVVIEDQLESALLSSRLSGKRLDVAERLGDARHEKGFVATFGGWSWTVKAEESPERRLLDEAAEPDDAWTLDHELAGMLTHLNALQRQHDREVRDVDAARGQLFADWCKYMRIIYPPEPTWQDHETFDGDVVRTFIEQEADALQQLEAVKHGATKSALVRLRERVRERVDHLNEARLVKRRMPLALYKIPAPRFHRPTEPVLLLSGKAVRSTERHGQDGRGTEDDLLRCELSATPLLTPERIPDVDALCRQIDALRGTWKADRIGFCAWQEPWHPILLEWEVDLVPLARSGGGDRHAPDHLTGRDVLAANAVELAASVDATRRKTYRGASILSPHAQRRHEEALRSFVVERVGCSRELLERDRAQVEKDYHASVHDGRVGDDPVATALRALAAIENEQFLSQSLTGINDAFLGLHQSYQLRIADPMGFECERDLARRVRHLVRSHGRSAPDDAEGFDPIRAGHLHVKRLRLVDTFGQIEDLRVVGPLHASRSLRAADGHALALPPRFVQPARLNLRWLSVADGTAEAGSAPASSPICGWIILDNLDRCLLVHDSDGRALGVIGSGSGLWQAGWQPAPGNRSTAAAWNIRDAHLRRLAEWLVEKSRTDEWDDVLENIEAALEEIDPEGSAHHEDLAVLMGRPLAVVRAQLSVSLAGPPAIHQGAEALFMDLTTGGRRTDGFEDVEIPVRLGAHERANDGLVAYWREHDGRLGAEAQWPRPLPQVGEPPPIHVAPSADLDPVILTMLVDPLAEVHATSGVLPTKAISIPASMYVAELKRLEITFRSLGPILTRMGRLDLPLPMEPGFAWTWLERDDLGWTSVAADVGRTEDDGAFSGPVLAREGWLRLTRTQRPDAARSGSTDAEPAREGGGS